MTMSAEHYGEETFKRFKRLIDSYKDKGEQVDFMARLLSKFNELHPLEFRDCLEECFDAKKLGDEGDL